MRLSQAFIDRELAPGARVVTCCGVPDTELGVDELRAALRHCMRDLAEQRSRHGRDLDMMERINAACEIHSLIDDEMAFATKLLDAPIVRITPEERSRLAMQKLLSAEDFALICVDDFTDEDIEKLRGLGIAIHKVSP